MVWFENVLMVVLIIVALAVGVAQVVLRYVFDIGFPWSEGAFVTFTVWSVLIAGSCAVRNDLHVKVEFFVHFYGIQARRVVDILANAISLVFCLFLAYCGFLYAHFVWELNAVSLEAYIPEWLIYGIVPVSMTSFSLRYLQRLWLLLTGGAAPEPTIETRIAQGL